MKTRCGRNLSAARGVLAFVLASGMALSLLAGEDIATSPEVGFWLDTERGPYALHSVSAVDAFSAHSVTYRAGETVTAIRPDGESVDLVSPAAASAGTVSFAPAVDGLWRLENSNGSEVLVGVAWGVFGEGWSRDFASATPFGMHTDGEGPDRKGNKRSFPDVAYSGDHWRGSDAAASLAFTAPDGKSTVFDLNGSGTQSFKFNHAGRWIVRLVMSDETALEAAIQVGSGFILCFR